MSDTILIADDDQLLAKMYRLNLEGEGFHVEIVRDGKEAVDAIDRKRPGLLLLDLLMPTMDGYAVLAYIQRKKYHFPILVLSNLSQDIDQKKCLELGAKDYFIKSDMDMPVLVEKVKKYMG